ncbi:MAG: prenyltransferase/squalene oxidase repeat-containing protein [Aureliella sp.]
MDSSITNESTRSRVARGEAPCDLAAIEQAWQNTWQWLERERGEGAHWTGELSTSALSTATAISALFQAQKAGIAKSNDVDAETVAAVIQGGCDWLAAHQNPDGGFGDTDRSHSNIATTYLVLAAWKMTSFADRVPKQYAAANEYVDRKGGRQGLRQRYGKDKTFVVPILSNCALAGLVEWKQVPALPFEAAWLPQEWYRLARMPVVSYAIPALVAIGQAKFHFAPPWNPISRMTRRLATEPTLRVLANMQPTSGGYLEATPLTSFVLMNLAAIGRGQLPVARNCLRFLLDSCLEDGSWPIDTNLATWVTSLTLNARAQRFANPTTIVSSVTSESDSESESKSDSEKTSSQDEIPDTKSPEGPELPVGVLRWLLSCQHLERHPFTGANPGGWGWTNLSGAVPDADDTPAALLALASIDLDSLPSDSDEDSAGLSQHSVKLAVGRGLRWLLRLQNRDGGWPTFCRGWGKLPFDRSGTDLTAHALRAIHAWKGGWSELEQIVSDRDNDRLPDATARDRAFEIGKNYLGRTQQTNGSWLPLWFGNQDRADEDNPVYGTSRVLLAYAELGETMSAPAQRAIQYLRETQNMDGGWGGGVSVLYPSMGPQQGGFSGLENGAGVGKASTIEETAVAVDALIRCAGEFTQDPTIMAGLRWLVATLEKGEIDHSWPIGFYFAKLWYHERLYPSIFSLSALGTALRYSADRNRLPD